MYAYNRDLAVKYAQKWWNKRNPAYRVFKDDCSNFISQCLYAGGFPMEFSKSRTVGWWYKGNSWSFSWTVAHALMLYLVGSRYTKQVSDISELELGDIICLDFEGDGRFNHSLIITDFDDDNNPLVNAHSYDSSNRNWKYEDSSAYTPNIQYKFFHILSEK